MTDRPASGLPEASLNLLRVVAVTCVVADHALGLWGPTVLRVPLTAVGHAGVAIFFVHTAAVLMASLERMPPGSTASRTATFMLRRALRIYPLAIVAILAVVAIGIPASAGRLATPSVFAAPDTRTLLANLALVQNVVPNAPHLISVLWTLPIEMQLYLLLPVAFAVARRGVRGAVIMLVVTIPIAVLVRARPWSGLAVVTALRFAPCFAAGVLAWALCRASPTRARWSWAVSIGAAAALLIGFVVIRPWDEGIVKWWVFCLGLGLVVPKLPDLPTGWLARASEQVALHSYGVYLFHVPLLWLAFQRGRALGAPVSALVFASALVIVCAVSYRLIEKPGIELGRRLSA